MNPIILGSKVKDKITGFSGIAVHRTEFLNGCIRVGVQPQELKDGKPIEVNSFDEQQLDVLEGIASSAEPVNRPGGPAPEPTRESAVAAHAPRIEQPSTSIQYPA